MDGFNPGMYVKVLEGHNSRRLPAIGLGPVDNHHVVSEFGSKFDIFVLSHELFPFGFLRQRHLQVVRLTSRREKQISA